MKGDVAPSFEDAIYEAWFRAALTRRRYRVRREPNNRLWEIQETQQIIEGARV